MVRLNGLPGSRAAVWRTALAAWLLLVGTSGWAGVFGVIHYPFTVYPPWVEVDSHGDIAGVHGNLIKAVLGRAKIEFKSIETPFVRSTRAVDNGTIGLMQYAGSGNDALSEHFFFPIPLVTLRVSVFSLEELGDDDLLAEAIGRKDFALIRGWPLANLEPIRGSPHAVPLTSPMKALQMLLLGRVAKLVIMRDPIDEILERNLISDTDAQRLHSRDLMTIKATTFAVPKSYPQAEKLSAAIAAAYQSLVSEGKVDSTCTCLKADLPRLGKSN